MTIAISIFDVTPDMLPDRRVDLDVSAPNVELCLVRGYIQIARPPQRDSYGIRTDRPRQHCTRCGIRYSASNFRTDDDTCRDCAEVVALIGAEMKGWCNDTHAERA